MESDAEAFRHLYREENCAPFIEPLKESLEETRVTLRRYSSQVYPVLELGHFGIFSRKDHALIGMAALYYGQDIDPDTLQLGYLIDVQYRNRGYALWACRCLLKYAKEMGVSSVICLVRPENYRSCRLAERLGFQWEEQVTYQSHIHRLYRYQLK